MIWGSPSPDTLDDASMLMALNGGYGAISGELCEKVVNECMDADTYPNIGEAFRGYNIILGDPLEDSGEPGYRAHIFDEMTERYGSVRFGNVAGNDLNRCDGSVTADFLGTSEQLFSSIVSSEGENTGFSVGPEMEVSGGAELGPLSASVSRTIPPIYESVGSNSRVMQEISSRLNEKGQKITRTRFNCYEYQFGIYGAQHPVFTTQFKDAVQKLDECLTVRESAIPYDYRTSMHDACVKNFFENYGTHYIKAAKFGSKLSFLSVLYDDVTSSADQSEMRTCASQDSRWSFLGFFGGGSMSKTCEESAFNKHGAQSRTQENDKVLTIGSRPKADYIDWADQKGKPEIIHKTVAPISELFHKDYMEDLDIPFEANGTASIKVILGQYIAGYCGLYPSQCKYVSKRSYCPEDSSNPTKSKYSPCDCDIEYDTNCGLYTGPVDKDFLPNGDGNLNFQGKVLLVKFVHGVASGQTEVKPDILPESTDCFMENMDYMGGDINENTARNIDSRRDAKECQLLCKQRPGCKYFTWRNSGHCWLKNVRPNNSVYKVGSTTGKRDCSDCFDYHVDYPGEDVNLSTGFSEDRQRDPQACQRLCQNRAGCEFFTWKFGGECWLKRRQSGRKLELADVSGPKKCKNW